MKLKLQGRYSLIIIVLVMAIAGILTSVQLIEFKQSFRALGDLQRDTLSEQLITSASEQGQRIAQQLAENLTNPLYYLSMEEIQQLLEVALAQPDITSVNV
ncbi:MAG: hypothetical protein AAGE01_11975, partial [Pseudomonadota bacterium]